jgi:ABC-type lipoprotein release transport system permease subunit
MLNSFVLVSWEKQFGHIISELKGHRCVLMYFAVVSIVWAHFHIYDWQVMLDERLTICGT